ncbi:MAG: iron-containing alcohol dehydrogenase [Oscillospiraceae bacterium]|jgi:alcohol dehydrogenase class IV|nr:iron-containing alcohol dehydrogenase [Oscillospiraceae bacterium]
MGFNFNLPVNLAFGRGRFGEIGEQCARFGKHALLVISGGSAKRSGLYDRSVALLQKAGVSVTVFDSVQANPLTTTAYSGAEAAKAAVCDVVVGVGGGSVMDAAKAIAFIAKNSGDISDYIFGRSQSDDALPVILAPTTCGTGSEANGFAVLTNPENGDKKSLRCNAIVAKCSIIDPELMETMPRTVLASCGFDALCHCMEAFVSKNASPITDALAKSGMELAAGSLVPLFDGSGSPEQWDALTLGATLGGMVIGIAGVTAPHALEHPASGLRNIVHGAGLAALTPAITERSVAGNPEKYAVIARILGGADSQDCAGLIRRLLRRLELETTLGAQGIDAGDIPWMAENCMRVSAAGIAAHPTTFTQAEIAEIYNECL